MSNRQAKKLRKSVTGDPDFRGRLFAREDNLTTWMLHPDDERKQYQTLKRLKKRSGGGENV